MLNAGITKQYQQLNVAVPLRYTAISCKILVPTRSLLPRFILVPTNHSDLKTQGNAFKLQTLSLLSPSGCTFKPGRPRSKSKSLKRRHGTRRTFLFAAVKPANRYSGFHTDVRRDKHSAAVAHNESIKVRLDKSVGALR